MSESGVKGLETLQVMQRAMNFTMRVYRQVLPILPEEEKWALSNQLRRSAQSIPANIVEGYGRYYYQEGIRFCYNARGSLEETFSHLALARELGYIQSDVYNPLLHEIQELKRMLNGYIAFLKRSKRGVNEPGANLSTREGPDTYLPNLDPDFPNT